MRPSFTAAFTISAAAGAAAVPPYTAFSTNTESAILRVDEPYGANPMNQACEGASASSAVPVLPATGTLADARRPVPEVTTSRMNRPSVRAASTLRTDSGTEVRALVSSVIQRPCGMEPPFATVAATRAIWNGEATTCPCPYEDCGSDFFNCAAVFGDAEAMPSRFAVAHSGSAPTS